jgi:hypothetical protein
MPLQAELLPAAAILLRYLCHFDAAKVDLSGPDPKFIFLTLFCFGCTLPLTCPPQIEGRHNHERQGYAGGQWVAPKPTEEKS